MDRWYEHMDRWMDRLKEGVINRREWRVPSSNFNPMIKVTNNSVFIITSTLDSIIQHKH